MGAGVYSRLSESSTNPAESICVVGDGALGRREPEQLHAVGVGAEDGSSSISLQRELGQRRVGVQDDLISCRICAGTDPPTGAICSAEPCHTRTHSTNPVNAKRGALASAAFCDSYPVSVPVREQLLGSLQELLAVGADHVQDAAGDLEARADEAVGDVLGLECRMSAHAGRLCRGRENVRGLRVEVQGSWAAGPPSSSTPFIRCSAPSS